MRLDVASVASRWDIGQRPMPHTRRCFIHFVVRLGSLTSTFMQKLIECVPNFSEGRDQNAIRQITAAIASVEGVFLLDVDPGATTNRTVVTFVGSPEAAVEAAFRGIQKAAELID